MMALPLAAPPYSSDSNFSTLIWLCVATALTVRSVNSIWGPTGGTQPFEALSAISIWPSRGVSSTFSLPSVLTSTALSIAPSGESCRLASNGGNFTVWDSNLIDLITMRPISSLLSATAASSHLGNRGNTSSATVTDSTSILRMILTSPNTDPNSGESETLSIFTSCVVPSLTFCRMMLNPPRIDTRIEPIETGSLMCSEASFSMDGT